MALFARLLARRGQLPELVRVRLRRVERHCSLDLRGQPPGGLHRHLLPVSVARSAMQYWAHKAWETSLRRPRPKAEWDPAGDDHVPARLGDDDPNAQCYQYL